MLVLLILGVVAVVAVAMLFGRAGNYGATQRAKRAATVLILGALVLMLVGFTQFRFLQQSNAAGTVVLVLDVSESMSRDDVAPTRMQAAKEAATSFVDDLPTDLAVGLVAFSAQPTVLAQPTTNRSAVEDALVGLPRAEGTVIGDGLDTAMDVVEERWRVEGTGPAAAVLLSDGRDTGSVVAPEDAAARAARLEIPVYTVVLSADPTGSGAGPNLQLMDAIARETDGVSYTATTAGSLIDVYATIRDRLAVQLAITDFGAWFVGAAGVLAVAATIALLYALRLEMSRGAATKPVQRRLQPDARRSRPRRAGRARGARPRR